MSFTVRLYKPDIAAIIFKLFCRSLQNTMLLHITNHALVNYKQIIGLEMYCNILATAKWVVLGTKFILNCRKCAMCIHF